MGIDLPPRVRNRLDPAERYGLRLTLVAVALVIVAVPFASLAFEVLDGGRLTRFDGRTADALNAWSFRNGWIHVVLDGLNQAGRPAPLAALVVIGAVRCWRADRRRVAVFLVVTSASAGVVNTLVKLAVDRPRPVVDHEIVAAFGNSFPSGHAMGSTATYGALLVAFLPRVRPGRRRLVAGAVAVLVLAIGASRLLSGVHFVSDVVAGHLLGLAWLAGATAAAETWRDEERAEDAAGLDRPSPLDAPARP